ncbi:SWIM zinc finger family protein [Hamadaea tsunoensis]|uniref:SWIM zinc finger family protein n=1 Tax=Hamadaea tsunoensis TaxID=53368 RepID=UPI0004858E6C|nr:SWIM zinc finger family protein [Hamadaea tsunoensis]
MSDVRWSTEQVHALAPDASSLAAARKLATGSGWSQEGAGGEPLSLWGLCKGSGATPYQTCVDVTEPAYKCSCPSRKFPCKHALALLLRWSAGTLATADQPSYVVEWHAGRAGRAAKKAARESAPRTAEQERAAERRAEKRADRMAEGVAELAQWLDDQVRQGIAGLDRAGYKHFDQVAARLVDAQAAGLASALRRLGALPASGAGWEDRLLGELGLLRLLSTAAARIDDLPPELADTVRARLGHNVPTEQVLAGPKVRDVWQVIGVRDEVEERLSSRSVWLIGRDSGRAARVLSFAAPGQALPVDLIVGTEIDADVCYYPGAAPMRALVAARHGDVRRLDRPGPAVFVARALSDVADALAADPWITRHPLLLQAAVVPGDPWRVVDAAGDALPLDPAAADPWPMLSASLGGLGTLAAEWTPRGVVPLTMFTAGEAVRA